MRYGSLGIEVQKIYDVMEESRAKVTAGGVEAPDSEIGNEPGPEDQGDEEDDDQQLFENEAEADAKARWKAYAGRLVRMRVQLVVAPASEKRFIDVLRDAGVHSVTCPSGEYQGFIYNSKVEGETKTQPATRLPTHRIAYMQKAISSCLRAASGPAADENTDQVALGSNNMFFFLDGFRHGTATGYLNSFTIDDRKLEKHSALFYIAYEWSSLQKRRQRTHSEAPVVDTVEYMTVVTEDPLKLPSKNRLMNDTASNKCNFIGPVVTESVDTSWKLTYYDKKRVLGDARTPSTTNAGGPIKEPVRRLDGDLELVAYHGNSYDFYAELVHSFCLSHVVDLTALDDKCALAAIAAKKSYVGVCYTEAPQSVRGPPAM